MIPPGGLPTTSQSPVPNPDVARTLLQLLLKQYLPQTPTRTPPTPPMIQSPGGDKAGAAQQFLMKLLMQAKKYPGMEVPGYSGSPFASSAPSPQAPTSDQVPITPKIPILPATSANIGPSGAPMASLLSLLTRSQGNLPSLPPEDMAGRRM